MKIAIVGAGFCGLALSYFLSHQASVTLFESGPLGSGPSGLSSGLLHPFAGPRCRKTWKADEGMKATSDLIKLTGIDYRKGLFRPALTNEQKTNFFKASQNYPETKWCENGLFIPEALTIFSKEYVLGLFELSKVTLVQQKVQHLCDLSSFDIKVVTAGAQTLNLLPDLPLAPLKGQIIELQWPQDEPPLPYSLVCQKSITMSKDNKSCFIGATYERTFKDDKPDPRLAEELLRPVAEQMLPFLKGAKLLSCRAGLRMRMPGHPHPLIKRVSNDTWVFTALGSKGLLHHAWMAKELAGEIRAV